MSITLRIILIIVSVFTFLYVMRRINKSQMQITDSIYWILFSVVLVILSIFPQIVDLIKDLLGIASAVNCIFLVIIFLLIMKIFGMSIKVSQLENKIVGLTQRYAIDQNKMQKPEEEK